MESNNMRTIHSVMFVLSLAFLPSPSHALTVGEFTLYSALGEPLRASIQLQDTFDLSADDIKVEKASSDTYKKLGVEPLGQFQPITFTVRQQGNGFIVDVASDEPVREPYIDFIVQVKWPTGQVYKNIETFLDPRR